MLKVGDKVKSSEHKLETVGTVIRVSENGDATIQFETPVSRSLPYGHIINEFWPVLDQSELTTL